jgi:transcription antitermination factor NusG
MKACYVLAIRSQQHVRLSERLLELGIELWYPMRAVWRKHRSKPRQRKEYPLIPSYMFVWVDLEVISVREILSIDGAISFLNAGGHPEPVPEGAMQAIRQCNERGDHDETLKRIEKLMIGREVIIDAGPFNGHRGVVTRIKGDTITADVWLFGRRQPIKISIDKVIKP